MSSMPSDRVISLYHEIMDLPIGDFLALMEMLKGWDDSDPSTGVREPRNPKPSPPAPAVMLEPMVRG